jgi:hypothetical protein
MSITNISKATDRDAEYILRRIAEADECEAQAGALAEQTDAKRERAVAARVEAGQRLIEVHAVRTQRQKDDTDKVVSVSSLAGTWRAWLEENGINRETARRHMALAGFTEEERTERRKSDTARKREARARTFKIGWRTALSRYAGVQTGGDQQHRFKALTGETPPRHFTSEADAKAFVARWLALFPPKDTQPVRDEDAVKLARAIAKERARLAQEFEKEVAERVRVATQAQRDALTRLEEEAREEKDAYYQANQKANYFITREDFDFVLNCLHPDRAPDDRKERFAKAFAIMQKLKTHFGK